MARPAHDVMAEDRYEWANREMWRRFGITMAVILGSLAVAQAAVWTIAYGSLVGLVVVVAVQAVVSIGTCVWQLRTASYNALVRRYLDLRAERTGEPA